MDTVNDRNLTQLLEKVQAGEAGASDKLASTVYDDLRAMAARHLAREHGGGRGARGLTIQPTVLADDTLMNLIRQRQRFDSTGHFFAIASRVMMRVLIDYHRERKAAKRGGGALRISLEPKHDRAAPSDGDNDDVDVEAVAAALEALEKLDARKAEVVRYRIIWGLTVPEAAEALGVGRATVERDWSFVKTWLAKELSCHQ